ncbi:hypothetical protein F5144DRAFT_639778 [Chaetomium tenue]|uniref:Uncharacterized protein n=1 Tax=Chaetomium tenue TaxID=1854479 RepID=A0ACB7PF41_9PEZI|nr:hypothetical protein F5144DRAFT_639778 [Chaetomium globosum]
MDFLLSPSVCIFIFLAFGILRNPFTVNIAQQLFFKIASFTAGAYQLLRRTGTAILRIVGVALGGIQPYGGPAVEWAAEFCQQSIVALVTLVVGAFDFIIEQVVPIIERIIEQVVPIIDKVLDKVLDVLSHCVESAFQSPVVLAICGAVFLLYQWLKTQRPR